MKRTIAPLTALLVACARPPVPTPAVAPIAIAPVEGDAPGGPPPPLPAWRVVAHDVALVQRLGDVSSRSRSIRIRCSSASTTKRRTRSRAAFRGRAR